jgi:hypothetical protein
MMQGGRGTGLAHQHQMHMQAQHHHPQQHNNGANGMHHAAQQHAHQQQMAANPLLQQQLIAHAQLQRKEDLGKMQVLQNSLQQQQSALVSRDEEIAKLQKALREREDEVAQVRNGSQKLQKVKDAEVEKIKSVMQKEKEDKLAKLSAAHNKRVASKEEEIQALRAQLTKEKDKEIQKLSTVHQKQLKVKDDELAQVKDKMVREKDEKIQKLSSSVKELKQSLSLRDQELASMRKQLGSAHKAEEEAKKQRASADGQKQKEESLSKVEMAKLKGSIELACNEELKKLSESHEQVVGAKNREMAQLTTQLKSVLSKYQQGQTLLQREREKVRAALLDSGKLAEVSMQFSGEQEERLMRKVDENIQDCSVEEVHWLMTKTFRSWLAQSYSECDEVCDALEVEQQRLKRLSHAKEQELSKMRAHVGHLRRRVHWVYQVFALSMVGSMATGCVGAWRAISTGDFLASVQVMGLAWLVLLATVLILLFGDGGSPPFPPSAARDLQRDRGGGVRTSADRVGSVAPGMLRPNGEQRWRGARNGSAHAGDRDDRDLPDAPCQTSREASSHG